LRRPSEFVRFVPTADIKQHVEFALLEPIPTKRRCRWWQRPRHRGTRQHGRRGPL